MTIPALIDHLLGRLLREHYQPKAATARLADDLFMRDRQHLLKAIARYGYKCHQNGWEFDTPKLYAELSKLLDELKATSARGTEIRHLPVYLEAAVKRSIDYQAERFSQEAKRAKMMAARVGKAVKGVTPVVVREPSGAEVLAAVYRDLAKRRKAAKPKKAAPAAKQEALL